MNFVKRKWKGTRNVLALVLMLGIIFSGTSFVQAADNEYTDNVIPAMTGETTPSGHASSTSKLWDAYYPWKAFDGSPDTGWYATVLPGALEYEFPTPKKIEKYSITYWNENTAPANWTFDGWDGTQWVQLDKQVNIKNWYTIPSKKQEFSFSNDNSYIKYRLNITASVFAQGNASIIAELAMFEKNNSETDPGTDPGTDPDPEPIGDNALLVIKMISGLEKEFELTASEVQDFIDWYNGRADGRGKETYMFDKDFNKGPFSARKDYVAFSKIQSFEVMEYTK
ncbi:discoidin domain-containing protein [Brevibacillus porteri]|uniref:discoidin domain-containing protein n=1 Tax=Brevibacillus porteri TaxID=2126350 RepID=UPI003D232652